MLSDFKLHKKMKDINEWGIFTRLCHEQALMTNKMRPWLRESRGFAWFCSFLIILCSIHFWGKLSFFLDFLDSKSEYRRYRRGSPKMVVGI